MDWVFREQPFEDYGIDAHVEVIDNGDVLGWLLGVQVKSGPSYFRAPANDGWWFRESAAHFTYWLAYSIPVVVVLADLDSELCYWQLVTESTVVQDGGSYWKVRVPRSHVLDGSAVDPLRKAAEAGARRVRDRRPVGAFVSEFDPAELEVHAALPGVGPYADTSSEYLTRPHDQLLDELVGDALGPEAKSGFAVLVAPSGAGKTRALYEALHRPIEVGSTVSSLAEAGWRVWPALNPLPPRRFLDELALVGPQTVVWLNEAQRYLRDPSAELRADIATGLRELLADDSRGPVLVLGTLWHEYWQELTRMPDPKEIDQFVSARRLLAGSYVKVPDTFTNAEVSAARRSADQRVVKAASQVASTGVTQFLAGAPDLVWRYETADKAQRAVIHAAMDARRLGHSEGLQGTFLRDAARSYLTDAERRRADDDPSWFETAVAGLVRPGMASGPVLHQSPFGFRLDDFLDQEGRARRRFEFPPGGFWSVAAEGDVSLSNRLRLAEGAASRLRLRIAVRLYEAVGTEAAGIGLCDIALRCERGNASRAAERLVQIAVDAGCPEALMSLARLRNLHGGKIDPSVVRLLRQAADLGDVEAFDLLAHLLERSGDKKGAETVARNALELGSWEPTVSVASWRDIDFPGEAEGLIYSLPAGMRLAALASFASDREGADDPDGAEQLALSAARDGDVEILLALADQRAQGGQRAAARRLLEHITWPDTVEDRLRLALIHARVGNHAEARSLVELAVEEGAGLLPNSSPGFEGVDDRLVPFVEMRPQAIDQLAEVLQALDERHLVSRLFEAWGPPQIGMLEPDDDDEEPGDEMDDEVGRAYATLSEFQGKRGEFQEAEHLAFRAAAFGNSMGLEILSRELGQRGDREVAERLALCAVNMGLWSWRMGYGESSWTALAEARSDNTLLVSGLDADGNTAEPW